jgi:hypothetical protein
MINSVSFKLAACQVPSSLPSEGVLIAAKNLSTGEVANLYICHSGHFCKEMVAKARWIVSCWLPARYDKFSPFGGHSEYTVVTELDKDSFTLTVKLGNKRPPCLVLPPVAAVEVAPVEVPEAIHGINHTLNRVYRYQQFAVRVTVLNDSTVEFISYANGRESSLIKTTSFINRTLEAIVSNTMRMCYSQYV